MTVAFTPAPFPPKPRTRRFRWPRRSRSRRPRRIYERGYQLEVARWALEQGGHVRAALEDNLKYDHTRLADSNAALMAQVAALGAQDAHYPATPAEARLIHSFPALPSRPRREENHE